MPIDRRQMPKYPALSLALLTFPIDLYKPANRPTPERILLSNGILLSAIDSRPDAQKWAGDTPPGNLALNWNIEEVLRTRSSRHLDY